MHIGKIMIVNIGFKIKASFILRCISDEKALVTPQVGHWSFVILYVMQMLSPSKKSLGIIMKDKKKIM